MGVKHLEIAKFANGEFVQTTINDTRRTLSTIVNAPRRVSSFYCGLAIAKSSWAHAACLVSACLVGLAVLLAPNVGRAADSPITGDKTPGMESFDRLIPELLAKWDVPGAAVAVMHQGRLVLARGYGWADVDKELPVEPQGLFRLASVSKPITGVAVLRLVEAGKLRLDELVFERLEKRLLPDGAKLSETFDERWRLITVRQLLQHTGGWDRDASFDPMFRPDAAAKEAGAAAPADAAAVCRSMLQHPLDFDPGTKYAYSNFGYCLLGRLIEVASGKPYGDAVRELVFEPAGMHTMRLGRTLLEDRQTGEPHYYAAPRAATAESVFRGGSKMPVAYGGFYLEAMDAHGGWLGTTGDLLRMVAAVEGLRGSRLLQTESVAEMLARPPAPMKQDTDNWYGLGWSVRPTATDSTGPDANWSHNGALAGTSTILVRTSGGLSWAALLNAWPPKQHRGKSIHQALDETLWKAAGEVKTWPEHDLFAEPPQSAQKQE